MNYYNENDPKAAAWLRELIARGHIAAGFVDTRSIADVQPEELTHYDQCHFFAGIGGWALALRLAGVPDNARIDTGSCPCQPFSSAGLGLGVQDPRHLWPQFRRIIKGRKSPIVFGEQVASKAGRGWLAGVFADLEKLGYETAGADLCAAGIGAPHIRQRLYWVANANHGRCEQRKPGGGSQAFTRGGGAARGMADADGGDACAEREQCGGGLDEQPENEATGGPGNSEREGRTGQSFPMLGASHQDFWSDFDILACTDGKARRVESGTFPLAHGVSGRVGLLRGYGNAIVPQLAALFIEESLAAIREKNEAEARMKKSHSAAVSAPLTRETRDRGDFKPLPRDFKPIQKATTLGHCALSA